MKIVAVLLLCAALAEADVRNCPVHCSCQLEGASGVGASCSLLNEKEQRFTDAVQHLAVVNENRYDFKLTDNIFTKLGLKSLESIKIVNSSLTEISVKAFQGLTSLFEVNLSDNHLFLIHADTFANNTNLHRLKLSGNPLQLTQLLKTPHHYFLRSSSLTDFDISNCELSQLMSRTFSQLKNLVFINLSSNFLRSITKEVFEGLESLEDLDLSNNQIAKIDPNVFKANKNLSVLKLKKNPIELLNGINLPELEELHLSECKLRVLMKETIEGMPQLTVLNLNANQIEVISDDSFVDLKELKHLDLSNNKLIGPMSSDLFENNRNLESLSLSGNKDLGALVDEPGFTGNHLAMTKLELADCGLTNLTAGQLRGLENLNVLNVSNNAIRVLESNTFARLRSLNILDLSNNKLTTLPIALFAANDDLVKLRLRGNPLKQLPLYTFSYTRNLKFLDVSNCHLEKLWDERRRQSDEHKILPSLSFLDVSNNSIGHLHVYDFDTMDNLETIDLTGNPIQCLTPTIQLIEWFIKKEVDPRHQVEKIRSNGKEEKLKWNDIITTLCPVPSHEFDTAPKTETEGNVPLVETVETLETDHSTFTVDKIVVKDTRFGATSVLWPTIFAGSALVVALYFIIYLIGEVTHRRRTTTTAYTRPGSLGGHARTRGVSGSPLYYKLYEECSIPAQPVKTKKNYIIDFSPIHTVLKKGTYKIMKTNEVNV